MQRDRRISLILLIISILTTVALSRKNGNTQFRFPAASEGCSSKRSHQGRYKAPGPLIEKDPVNKVDLEAKNRPSSVEAKSEFCSRFSTIAFKNAVASSMAAVLSKGLIQPLDTIKTVQQLQGSPIAKSGVQGLFDTLRVVVEKRGVAGLWAGFDISMIGAIPSTALYFSTFESCRRGLVSYFPKKLRSFVVLTSAILATAVASVVRVPCEIYKQRLQAGLHKNLQDAIKYSWKNEGIVGLYGNGHLLSQLIRDVPYTLITTLSYEALQYFLSRQRKLHKAESPYIKDDASFSGTKAFNRILQVPYISTVATKAYYIYSYVKAKLYIDVYRRILMHDNHLIRRFQDGICGAVAGGFSSFITSPLDVMKTRLSIYSTPKIPSFVEKTYAFSKDADLMSNMHKIQQVWREMLHENAFFAGATTRVLQKIPANALFFMFYEAFRYMLGAVDSD